MKMRAVELVDMDAQIPEQAESRDAVELVKVAE